MAIKYDVTKFPQMEIGYLLAQDYGEHILSVNITEDTHNGYLFKPGKMTSLDLWDMRTHEASHLGLTVKEMETYRAIKSFAAYMGSVIANRKNEETERKYDEAIQAVIDFEKEHEIKA